MQPHDNWLLLSLPETDLLRLAPELQKVRLEKGRPLYRPGEKTEYAYFPLDCLIISTVYVVGRDPAAEIAVTGREGVVGLEVLLHDVPIPRIAVVHTTGTALRIRVELLTEQCAQSRSLRDALTRYMQALISQMVQISICNPASRLGATVRPPAAVAAGPRIRGRRDALPRAGGPRPRHQA